MSLEMSFDMYCSKLMLEFDCRICLFLDENEGRIAFEELYEHNRMFIYVQTNTPESKYSEVLFNLKKKLTISRCFFIETLHCGFTTICINSKIYSSKENNSFEENIPKQVMEDIKKGEYSITLEDGTEIPFVHHVRT